MKYCYKKYSIKFKLLFKEGVLTLEIYLPAPLSVERLGNNVLIATLDVTGMVKGIPFYHKPTNVIFFRVQVIVIVKKSRKYTEISIYLSKCYINISQSPEFF